MGPFVPEIITDELNLLVALLLGIAFGFVLEQAGFSSSRRLAGVFYGYDFTVLRVFFTAGATAMAGVLLLGSFGWLDLEAIFVNPMFLLPAIVGGIIMGFGFVVGGYCPGTSVAALAIGKVDALFFVVGGLLGVFLFGEFYPLYGEFHLSTFFGPEKVSDSLGMADGVFALMLIAVAVGAFLLTTKIEKKVNPESEARFFPAKAHKIAGAGALMIGVALVFLPSHQERILNSVAEESFLRDHPVKAISVDEFAFRIVDRDPRLQIFDLRDEKEYEELALPSSVNTTLDALMGKDHIPLLERRDSWKIFIDRDGSAGRQAALVALRLGYENVAYLEGGIDGLNETILQATFTGKPATETEKFRQRAASIIPDLIAEAEGKASPQPKAAKKIPGGC